MGKSVLFQLCGALFCALSSFFLTLFLARSMGTATFGAYVAVLNFAAVALIVLEGGWPTQLYRERVTSGGLSAAWRSTLAQAVAYVCFASTALFAVVSAVAPWLGVFGSLPAAVACMAAVATMNVVSGSMRGAGKFGLDALWQSSGRAVSALVIVFVVVVFDTRSPSVVFVAWSLGLCLVIGLGAHRWLVWPQVQGIFLGLRQVWPFALSALAMTWLLKGDMVVLAHWVAAVPSNVGAAEQSLSYYAACTRLVEACLLLFAPLANVVFGRFLQLAGQSAQALRRAGLLAVSVALSFGLSALVGSVLLGEWAMNMLFGEPFEPAGKLLPWVMGMLPFALVNMVIGPWMTALHMERAWLLLLTAAGFGMAASVYLSATQWGLPGAALAVAACQAVLSVAGFVMVGIDAHRIDQLKNVS